MASSISEQLIAEVIRLYPSYITNPLDVQWNHGNAVAVVVDPDGEFHGHIFGDDKSVGQKCYQVATRKVLQVWRTGYPTGRFEELVYAGKLDEGSFGVQRPDLIGWEGGVPFIAPDGRLIAAAFSGFRGVMDVEILVRAADAIGLKVKPNPGNL
jgi:glc operon protein GlcG